MLGGLLSLLSALTFAFNNAGIRRGVLGGTVAQAMAVSVPVGIPIFVLPMLVSGATDALLAFSARDVWLLSIAGEEGEQCNGRPRHQHRQQEDRDTDGNTDRHGLGNRAAEHAATDTRIIKGESQRR